MGITCFSRVRKPKLSFTQILLTILMLAGFSARAQTESVVQLINGLGQDAVTTLNSGSNFVTSFKGTNDVTISLPAGRVNSIYQENSLNSGPNNNPGYLTNFIGQPGNGTGNGTAGPMMTLETALSASPMTLQFDFSIPLTPSDRVLLFDADSSEVYTVEAFHAGQVLDLTSWPVTNLTGSTGELPNANWPTWATSATNGTLAATTSGNVPEPLVALAPATTVDRFVLNKLPVGSGSLAIQFVTIPPMISAVTLSIQQVSSNAVLSWPESSNVFGLYKTASLPATNGWTHVTTAPVLKNGRLVVTNAVPGTATFYRLQAQ